MPFFNNFIRSFEEQFIRLNFVTQTIEEYIKVNGQSGQLGRATAALGGRFPDGSEFLWQHLPVQPVAAGCHSAAAAAIPVLLPVGQDNRAESPRGPNSNVIFENRSR